MPDSQGVLVLTEEETKSIREITALYKKVKRLVIDTEEWNNKKAFAPTLLELRNALDHLMRFYAYKFGDKTDVQDDYPSRNLFKAKGHLFRAGYDSLDYLSIEITKNILEYVEPFSNEAINHALPEYFDKIRPDLDDISTTIANIRASKDMDNKNSEDFDRHIEAIEKLRSHNKEVLKKMNSLIEYEDKKESDRKSESNREFKNMIKGAIIAGIILLIIDRIFIVLSFSLPWYLK